MGLLSRMLDGNILIKMFHRQEEYAGKYADNGAGMQKSSVDLNILYLVMNLASWSMIMVPYQAIMYGVAGTWYFESGVPTIGLMLAFANYANSLIGPFLSVQRYQQNWTYAKVCLNNIMTILSIEQEGKGEAKQSVKDVRHYSFHGKGISFGYREDSPVLKNKTFDFEENKLNLIFGKSGS